jgi:glycolate oxidase iron-sulfur subunit
MDSPRGRIYLMRAAAEGRAELTPGLARHLDLCLGCRACETACPSGVPFGQLLEATRAQLDRKGVRAPESAHATLEWALSIFPHPDRLGALLWPLRLYQASGLRTLVRASGMLAPFKRLQAMDALLPRVLPSSAPLPELIPARGKARGRAALLTGCVQRFFFPEINVATARLLSAAGWEVVVPRGQGCCGALHLHAGRLDEFRAMARSLMATLGHDVDIVVTNAAGCGSALKEYGHWLGDEQAERFAAFVKDISEALIDAELPLGELRETVTYHDACHLAHGQKVRAQPRELLRRIPGLTLVDLKDSDLCCGSAGVYNLLEPEMAAELGRRKIERIRETGARVVATGNPGCIMQISQQALEAGLTLEVMHPVTLLSQALREP